MKPIARHGRTLGALLLAAALSACTRIEAETPTKEPVTMTPTPDADDTTKDTKKLAEATVGGGCFWCVEAVFEELKGVASVESGYSGGHVENPTYEQVCGKKTGHAEVCRIKYDPEKVTFAELLKVFFLTHDPTTKDRQGNDVGPQYRSVIYTHDDKQLETAKKLKKELDASGAWKNPIVTEIEPIKNYYPAEAYHQDYYKNNPNQGYCAFVIRPKMDKFRKVFKDHLKK